MGEEPNIGSDLSLKFMGVLLSSYLEVALYKFHRLIDGLWRSEQQNRTQVGEKHIGP